MLLLLTELHVNRQHCGHNVTQTKKKTDLFISRSLIHIDHGANSLGEPSVSPGELASGKLAFGQNECKSCTMDLILREG